MQYYTIAVGKLNVPKMANFLEIDVFVLVACPENSLLDSQEFYKPVVTPFEMEIACIRYNNSYSGTILLLLCSLLLRRISYNGPKLNTQYTVQLHVLFETRTEVSLLQG